jgi:hypothetical protein
VNYTKIYYKLIESRKALPTSSNYHEKHHILPKCLGGSNDKNNLVLLTAREHYIAHWLLTKIYPNDYKIWSAFALMSGKLSPKADRTFSDRDFERCRQAQSIAAKLRSKIWNPMESKEAREKISNRMKNKELNPISKNPGKNWTAKPVEVELNDGTIYHFQYGKLAAKTLGIPYSTWKWSLKYTNGRINKYNIKNPKITFICFYSLSLKTTIDNLFLIINFSKLFKENKV